MTRRNLEYILQKIMPIIPDSFALERLYEPEYKVFNIGENQLKYIQNGILFDYKSFDFEFVYGEITCTGIWLNFKHQRFENIKVNPVFDYTRNRIINYVLCRPKYTDYDWIGKKSIAQNSATITSNKQLKSYIEKLYSRFECPILF